jgi:nitroreductase
VNKRRTVRDFEKFEIDEDIITKIIEAAFKAPTNDHMRDWHFIIITDKPTVMKLISKIPDSISEADMEELIKNWDLSDYCQQNCYRDAVPKQNKMLADSSCIIVPLFKQKVDLMHPENLSHLNGFASIWCAIENLLLAATAENLACNLRIPLGEEDTWARKVLRFPEDYLMPCFIGLGKPIKDLSTIVQKEIILLMTNT